MARTRDEFYVVAVNDATAQGYLAEAIRRGLVVCGNIFFKEKEAHLYALQENAAILKAADHMTAYEASKMHVFHVWFNLVEVA